MKASAGILLYRKQSTGIHFFLVHPGGPFWKNKDAGAWSIPKGELAADEDPLERAKLEFEEETGHPVTGRFVPLTPVKQKAGKLVFAWAVEGDIDTTALSSNTFNLQWPPGSGKIIQAPEVDRWEWFGYEEAKRRINPAQVSFIEQAAILIIV
ncbi:NUDIX hydrolase [Niabella ginsenosidivorans]|uniref:NUDIX hydrolase n=1 Tax=Niabella ginsenosidivorans TaxID=1176587 RepID=A0A1A9I290_9BACT|nr:NUDIX domain-containing protein [Niabella ginsenosidivorans]ANH81736.1 NUDIX hydrolase [Niabella ginsenosidivorans]